MKPCGLTRFFEIQMTKPKSILLIDDDLMVRLALGQALEVENYHVVSAANRHEALREVGQHSIDIVLIDLNPRSENGWEMLQCLTTLQPHLRVVAMTARLEQHQPSSNAHGVDVILEKPFNLSVLLQTLNELTQQSLNPRWHCPQSLTARS
jgi:CheY-like chemotaxis protein